VQGIARGVRMRRREVNEARAFVVKA
jgi:hypothetical protein